MTALQKLIDKSDYLAAGLMSGTSMDGVDAAIVRLPDDLENRTIELIGFCSAPYPEELRDVLRSLSFGEACKAEDIATLGTSVAVAFAHSFHAACREAHVDSDSVDFIGSHGQTVAHVPPGAEGAVITGTLQLGPPGTIAALTGVTTVGDFRVTDMGLGGQGAPLAPYPDFLMRRSESQGRVILNIGGIANVTYLPKNAAPNEVIAFDAGPGNMVTDELYRVLFPKEVGYENLVAHIREGTPSESIIKKFMEHPYFQKKPPKSAGHREFGTGFSWEFHRRSEEAGLKKADILVSSVLLTAEAIERAIREHIGPHGGVDEVFVTGGGSHNAVLMEALERRLAPAAVKNIIELGIPADAKEAVDFAVLARETIRGRPNVIHSVTGATRPAVLGTIAMGNVT